MLKLDNTLLASVGLAHAPPNNTSTIVGPVLHFTIGLVVCWWCHLVAAAVSVSGCAAAVAAAAILNEGLLCVPPLSCIYAFIMCRSFFVPIIPFIHFIYCSWERSGIATRKDHFGEGELRAVAT